MRNQLIIPDHSYGFINLLPLWYFCRISNQFHQQEGDAVPRDEQDPEEENPVVGEKRKKLVDDLMADWAVDEEDSQEAAMQVVTYGCMQIDWVEIYHKIIVLNLLPL